MSVSSLGHNFATEDSCAPPVRIGTINVGGHIKSRIWATFNAPFFKVDLSNIGRFLFCNLINKAADHEKFKQVD